MSDAQSGSPLILFSGGGSGGHLIPGVATAEEVHARHPDWRVHFVTASRPVERTILDQTPFAQTALDPPSTAILKRHPLRFWRQLQRAKREARYLLESLKPRLIVGLGGFASVPAITVARKSIPVVLLEQNVVPGRATSHLSRRASRICLSFPPDDPESLRWQTRGKAIVTGNPVRSTYRDTMESGSRRTTEPGTVVILGGSQGDRALNNWLWNGPTDRCSRHGWKIVHVTGTRSEPIPEPWRSMSSDVYEPHQWLADPVPVLRSASLIISRAGGTTIAELACLRRPTLLCPLEASARDHQYRNADYYLFHRAMFLASVGQNLTEMTERLMTEPGLRNTFARRLRGLARPDAASRVVDEIEQLLRSEPDGRS